MKYSKVCKGTMCFMKVESFKINNVSRKYFKAREIWCMAQEVIMSCKLGILIRWVNYVSSLLNGISNVNFITDRAVSV